MTKLPYTLNHNVYTKSYCSFIVFILMYIVFLASCQVCSWNCLHLTGTAMELGGGLLQMYSYVRSGLLIKH